MDDARAQGDEPRQDSNGQWRCPACNRVLRMTGTDRHCLVCNGESKAPRWAGSSGGGFDEFLKNQGREGQSHPR